MDTSDMSQYIQQIIDECNKYKENCYNEINNKDRSISLPFLHKMLDMCDDVLNAISSYDDYEDDYKNIEKMIVNIIDIIALFESGVTIDEKDDYVKFEAYDFYNNVNEYCDSIIDLLP